MFRPIHVRTWLLLAAAGLAAAASPPAPATAQPEFLRLLPKLPRGTNAVALVDLKALFNSPIALKEDWADRNSQSPLFPPRLASVSDLVVYGSSINFGEGFSRDWEAVLAYTKAPLTAKQVAEEVGGAVDHLAGTDIVWDPRDAFIVVFSPREIGALLPADRQQTARWIREAGQAGDSSELSPYLAKAAAAQQGYDHQIIMAFDTADLFSPALMRPLVASTNAFDLKLHDLDAVKEALGTVEGVIMGLKADTAIEGIVKVDFAGSTKPLERIAKPLLIEALQAIGADLGDLRDWRVKVEDRSITIQGPLTTSGARRMASLIELDPGLGAERPSASAEGSPGDAQPEPAQPGTASPGATAPTLQATQKYYRDLMALLDDIKQDKAKSQRTVALWCDRYATKIDRMPIPHVDPGLLDFSRRITVTLRELSQTGKGARLNLLARQTTDAATSTGGGYGYYGYGYGPYLEGTSRLAMERISNQENVKATAYETQVWAAVEQALNDVDRLLTMRYGVEF